MVSRTLALVAYFWFCFWCFDRFDGQHAWLIVAVTGALVVLLISSDKTKVP